MRFYLGTHKPVWLARTAEPLFVSRRTLAEVRKPPRAIGIWALDSGGFSELSMFGEWRTSPAAYVAEARRWSTEVGGLQWAAIQDWMCEPFMLARTGLSVVEHQRRTVASLLELRGLAPELPWAPVLQGYRLDEYLRCADLYEAAGINLAAEPVVGLGSVCRRQATAEARVIVRRLATERKLKLHGFGFKVGAGAAVGACLASSDSLAWSQHARHRPPLPGHEKPGPGRRFGHRSCANCLDYALAWRKKVVEEMRQPPLGRLFDRWRGEQVPE